MADNFWKVRKGITFQGYEAPTNPVDGDVYFDTIQGFLGYNFGSWGPLGGSGVINYNTNPNVGSTVGYNLYNNGPVAIPTTGTGGTVTNLTFTTTSVSPLVGHTMGVLTKAAFNDQGEGLSYDFTIDKAFTTSTIGINFTYQASANFVLGNGLGGSNSDIEIFVYDVTNNVLIPVTPYQLTAGVATAATYSGTFQPNLSSINYRLIWHIATTNALAWTFNFTEVIISPQAIKSFNNTPVSIVGQIIDVATDVVPPGTLECNGVAVSRATYSNLFNQIGTRYGIGDGSTTFNIPDLRGIFTRGWDHGAGNDPDAAARIEFPTLTTFNITGNTDGTTGIITGVSASNYKNLSLGMQISTDTGSAIPIGSIIISLNGGGSFTINNNTTLADVGDTITISAGATGDYVGSYQPFDVENHLHHTRITQSGPTGGGNFTNPAYMSETIGANVYGALNTNTDGGSPGNETRPVNVYVMKCIIYDSALAASSVGGNLVAARFNGTWSGSMPGSGGTIVYNTVVDDNYGAYNPSTGVWTCPVSGIYITSAIASIAAVPGHSATAYIGIYLNGTEVVAGASAQSTVIGSGTTITAQNAEAYTHLTLTAGDQVMAVWNGTSGVGTFLGAVGNQLDIVQISVPQSSQSQGLPVGVMLDFGGANLPGGYLFCDGSSQLISSYPSLAIAMFDPATGNYSYGSADALHFNLPPGGVFYRAVDYANAFDPDSGTRTAVAPGGNTGNNIGSYQVNQNLEHQHIVPFVLQGGHVGAVSPGGSSYNFANVVTEDYSNVGGNQANPNNVYVNKIIKYQ